MGYIGMYSPLGVRFSAVLVINRVFIFGHLQGTIIFLASGYITFKTLQEI